MTETRQSGDAAAPVDRTATSLRSVLGVAGIGLITALVTLLGTHSSIAAGGEPNGSTDTRQSPYFRGYDFYAGRKDQGTYGDGEIHPWHVQGDIWLMAGEPDESNVAVQIGNDGALVVDSGTAAMAPKMLVAINGLAAQYAGDQKDIRWIIDTDGFMDHVGGNEVLRNGGGAIVGGNFAFDNPGLTPGATVIGSLKLLTRMVAPDAQGHPAASKGTWPNETHTEPVYSWDFNDEAVTLYHPVSANTDGNEMVAFRKSDVLVMGDVLMMTSYPIISEQTGGTIDGELAALNQAIELAVPDSHNGPHEGGTIIIPGHGRLCDQADLVEYTIIVTELRNRIMYYKNRGKTVDQVLALNPTSDFDGRWDSKSGPWTAKDFVRAVYRTLPAKGLAVDRFSINAHGGD